MITCMPWAGRTPALTSWSRNSAARTWLLESLSVKKQWPDAGNEGWLTSPSTHTSASTASASRRLRTRRFRSVTRRIRGVARTGAASASGAASGSGGG
jgi:hypothetical protein